MGGMSTCSLWHDRARYAYAAAGTYLVPAERPGAGDEEGLRVLGEEDVPGHANRISEDGNEIRGDVGHGGMGICVEDLRYCAEMMKW